MTNEALQTLSEDTSGATVHDAPWVLTDPQGFILEASRAAAILLQMSTRALRHRGLYVFFNEDRHRCAVNAIRAITGEPVAFTARLRPREKRPIWAYVTVKVATDAVIPNLIWTFAVDTPAASVAPRP